MKLPDPLSVGFCEAELCSLLRHIIDCGVLYWEDDDSLEISHLSAISAQQQIMKYMLMHRMLSPVPEMFALITRALRLCELEQDENACLGEYLEFCESKSLASLCDELCDLAANHGAIGFNPLLFNILIFYESSIWYESPLRHDFEGDLARQFISLTKLVREYHLSSRG